MQTLRKKTSPLKYKNETSRFLGEGVSFKAKLIGILEVSEARGDRMCQEALSDLKMAIRAAGEHKQRITINIAIDGLRLRDEKTGDSLYHHPVHKISFIAQDMTDSRAFGYIFGSPDTGHRFFGIKTDKAASQVVIAMRDLFQVVFALKKKEIELAKQHLDKNRYGAASIFSESAVSNSKSAVQEAANKSTSDTKTDTTTAESKPEGPAVADLVDLELELNSLQQGITQMERITPSDPFGSKDDPFGDSFISYPPKPILPPPPSTRDRASRVSESSSIFSPKTPHTVGSGDTSSAAEVSLFGADQDFSFSEITISREEPASGDWFAPADKLFEEPPLVPEPTKEQQQHQLTKQEILSQFDIFTELDPLGTGKIKPYVDKKDFFQELKNPPKKVLNDLVSEKQPQEKKLFNANFEPSPVSKPAPLAAGSVDPFAEDPFDKTDPFAEADFSKQDPFDTESFGLEFKVFNKGVKPIDTDKFKFSPLPSEGLQSVFQGTFSKSPTNKTLGIEKQMSVAASTSPRALPFSKQNTFDVKLEEKAGKLSQVHENRSLDMSSESECAPEPPPRPDSGLVHIKPPPLPPKKQLGDLCVKPPPRPPYSDEAHYEFVENFETGPNNSDLIKRLDKSPQLPAPLRKAKFETDFSSPPQRPIKHFNVQGWSSEEDYLTPISFAKKEEKEKSVDPVLLPPPQRNAKKQNVALETTGASFFDSKPSTTTTTQKLTPLQGLDITLSQLTLSALNEVATKLDIPASQLSNMTLVQLTEYISNFIKNRNKVETTQFADFKADFANFNNFNEEPRDKYAVFRELLQEDMSQSAANSEPEKKEEEEEEEEEEEAEKPEEKLNDLNVKGEEDKTDRYAALREIVENEIKLSIKEEDNINEAEQDEPDTTKIKNETNIIDTEKKLQEKEKNTPEKEVIEYNSDKKEDALSPTPVKSPTKPKSPVSNAVSEVVQSANRMNSGSLSDVVSGSSPEIDNTGSTSEVAKKSTDAAAESWAIFDQPNLTQQPSRDKQSEEGVSPWSSDSKEFGNVSPPEWGPHADPTSWRRREEGWWDTSAEPNGTFIHQNEKTTAQYYFSNRRSTDSYDDEGYEYYNRPARRKRQAAWTSHGGAQPAGGHSSSSRDASPWEEEPRRREMRDGRDVHEHREMWTSRHTRGRHPFDRRDRRHTDSWDEEDDYEYDEEHSSRYHWPERHSSRESEKERHVGLRERDIDWAGDWGDSRRHRRRRELDRDRWCCPDWEQEPKEGRYTMGRWRKHDERYYSRESQESPWEDDYAKEAEEAHASRYLTTKRNWKRPSSASEMDRKTGETKARPYYIGTGGSDGERDRRYKGTRRSRSRDSQFSESASHARLKIDPGLTLRGPHRSKMHRGIESGEFSHEPKKFEPKAELSCKRSATLGRKKKESPKTEEGHTFPRRAATFENNFVPSEIESPISAGVSPRFTFENDFETSEAESPVTSKPGMRFEDKRMKPALRYDTKKTTFKEDLQVCSGSRTTQRSPFEDDFSPPVEKPDMHESITTMSIKEEMDGNEEEDSFGADNFDKNIMRKKLNKNRFSNNFDSNLKKSESINIFARESDPFDDEFFSQKSPEDDKSPRSSERKWTEDFED